MMMRTSTCVKALLLSSLLLMGNNAAAQVALDLFLCIDGSGSISPTDFNLQRQGTAQAIQQEIPATGQVRVTVLQFAGTGTTVEVPPTVINGSTLNAVVQSVLNMTQVSGGTPMASCIDEAVSLLGTLSTSSRQVIDISTDGQPNSTQNTIDAAAFAQQSGVDALNALAVGPGASISFLESIVFPQPAGGNAGFVEQAPDFNAFALAMARKISIEVEQIAGYCGVGNISDINGNGFPETAAATQLATTGKPVVYVRDQGSGLPVRTVGFFNSQWQCIAFSTELNRGTMLARHRGVGTVASQTRNLNSGAVSGRVVVFFPR